jgi:hypothetical protein
MQVLQKRWLAGQFAIAEAGASWQIGQVSSFCSDTGLVIV